MADQSLSEQSGSYAIHASSDAGPQQTGQNASEAERSVSPDDLVEQAAIEQWDALRERVRCDLDAFEHLDPERRADWFAETRAALRVAFQHLRNDDGAWLTYDGAVEVDRLLDGLRS